MLFQNESLFIEEEDVFKDVNYFKVYKEHTNLLLCSKGKNVEI